MEYLFNSVPIISIAFLLRTFVIEYYKNKRFENFKKIYKNEKVDLLSDYELKSKGSNISIFPKRNINDT